MVKQKNKLGQRQSQTAFSSAFWVQKSVGSKNLNYRKISGPTNFGSKKLWVQKILGPENFESKKIKVPKKF